MQGSVMMFVALIGLRGSGGSIEVEICRCIVQRLRTMMAETLGRFSLPIPMTITMYVESNTYENTNFKATIIILIF